MLGNPVDDLLLLIPGLTIVSFPVFGSTLYIVKVSPSVFIKEVVLESFLVSFIFTNFPFTILYVAM